MRKKEKVNPGVKAMAENLQELVWYKEVILERGPKSISTAKTNLGATDTLFTQVLEFALQNGLVHKTMNDKLTIQPPSDEVACHIHPLGVQPI